MRLINTHTLEFEEFEGQNIPSYGILSHKWEEQEVLFKDVERGTAVTKKGWQKITNCCELARQDGLSYAWVDTCCIDKRSSAELTEAINSMFRWYQQSKRCYVYLCDVHVNNLIWQEWESLDFEFNKWSRFAKEEEKTLLNFKLPMLSRDFVAEFCDSVWFTRGWTLQELLASENMIFFGSHWQMLGTKDFLCAAISHRTCIPASILLQKRSLNSVTIAERMSWAAKRDTTRIEDRAYSLMGIFGVHMPMLYGEGEAAFIRLQEEILKRSNDQSILLWSSNELGALAKSPAAFEIHLSELTDMSTRSLRPFDQSSFDEEIRYYKADNYFVEARDEAFAMTHTGLSIALYLVPWYLDVYLVPLKVVRTIKSGNSSSQYVPHIFLRQVTGDFRLHRVRFRGDALTYISEGVSFDLQFPYLGPTTDDDEYDDVEYDEDKTFRRHCTIAYADLTQDKASSLAGFVHSNFYGIEFVFEPNEYWGSDGILRAADVIARQRWSPAEKKIELKAGVWGVVAVFRIIRPSGKPSYMYVGFDREFTPCFVQKEWDHEAHFDDIVEARPDSDELSQVLAAWKFDDSVKHGNSEAQLVIKGTRRPFCSVLKDTAIPGLRLEISRSHVGYLFKFRNVA